MSVEQEKDKSKDIIADAHRLDRHLLKGKQLMAKREYMAYLLRMWRENHDADWRAILENPNSGERVGFARMEDLVIFLESKTGEPIRPNAIHDQSHISE
jgi:hypothetical protein